MEGRRRRRTTNNQSPVSALASPEAAPIQRSDPRIRPCIICRTSIGSSLDFARLLIDRVAAEMNAGRQTVCDLVEETKKPVVLLIILAFGLSYLMSRILSVSFAVTWNSIVQVSLKLCGRNWENYHLIPEMYN